MVHKMVVAGLIISAAAAVAQEGWLIPFAAAYQPDLAGFNTVLPHHGMPTVGDRQFGWGIEIRSPVSGFLLGPLFFRTWQDAQKRDFQLRTEAYGIFGELGIDIRLLRIFSVVPMIGVGGLNHSLVIRERSGDKTFDSLLRDPGRLISISPGMKLAGLAALELGFIARTRSGNYGLALRAGYLYSPAALTWRQPNGAAVIEPPATKLRGPFFSAGIIIIPEAQTISTYP